MWVGGGGGGCRLSREREIGTQEAAFLADAAAEAAAELVPSLAALTHIELLTLNSERT